MYQCLLKQIPPPPCMCHAAHPRLTDMRATRQQSSWLAIMLVGGDIVHQSIEYIGNLLIGACFRLLGRGATNSFC